jgi:hypothetical protein
MEALSGVAQRLPSLDRSHRLGRRNLSKDIYTAFCYHDFSTGTVAESVEIIALETPLTIEMERGSAPLAMTLGTRLTLRTLIVVRGRQATSYSSSYPGKELT